MRETLLMRDPYPGPVVRVAVAWGDCDPAGIAFYPTIFSWIDRGGRAVLRLMGVTKEDELATDSPSYPITAAEARFLSPIHLDDELDVRVAVSRVGRTSFSLAYELWREPDGVLVAVGAERRVKAQIGSRARLEPVLLDDRERGALSRLLILPRAGAIDDVASDHSTSTSTLGQAEPRPA